MTALPRSVDWWRIGAELVWLPTAAEMAALDRDATSSGAIPERALIENAGREVARLVQARWPEGPVVGLAGSGHNGADTLVALRTLRAWDREVRAILCGSRPPEPDVLQGWEIPVHPAEALSAAAAGATVLLDGVLGTGLTEAPREPQASAIGRANESGIPIVAVDGPSGADFTTGRVPGACIRAALTVSLGWPKLGLLRFPARARCGDLLVVEIGFPPPERPPAARAITAPWVQRLLPRRGADAHKGQAGYLMLVAGQTGMAGAAVLAARAAVRGGVGIVRVVGDPRNREIVQMAVPEAIFIGWDDERAVEESVEWAGALAVGPGLGRGPVRRALVERVLSLRGSRPVLLDADALNAWEGEAASLREALGGDALLTPHPGELARLMELEVADVVSDPPQAAREAVRALGCTVLLKGAPSVVAAGDEPLRVNPVATPALATGGTGDVLTGLAGAYLAAGAPAADAATAALFVSGLAATRGPAVGRSSADLPDEIPTIRAELETDFRLAAGSGVLFAVPGVAEDEHRGGGG